jgi:hypothetical protein
MKGTINVYAILNGKQRKDLFTDQMYEMLRKCVLKWTLGKWIIRI